MLYKITSRRKTVQSSKLMSLHSCEMAGYENLMVALGPVEKAEYLPKIDESTPPYKWNIPWAVHFQRQPFRQTVKGVHNLPMRCKGHQL